MFRWFDLADYLQAQDAAETARAGDHRPAAPGPCPLYQQVLDDLLRRRMVARAVAPDPPPPSAYAVAMARLDAIRDGLDVG